MIVDDAHQMTGAELSQLRSLIAAADWRSTTYLHPHQYVTWPRYPELCRALQSAAAAYGHKALWRGQPYRYLFLDGYRYWHFQIVFNREPLPGTE